MNLIRALLDLLYPPRCPFCGKVLDQGEDGLCTRCQTRLPWTGEEGLTVDFCDACFAPLWYRDGVRLGVHRYKFNSGRAHAKLFGTLMAQCLEDRLAQPAQAIVWVPLSPKHLHRRGYDQAELLARRVGELTGLPVLDALEKIRDTDTQSRLASDSRRRANVLGAYRVRQEIPLDGMRLVLVDDVVTSGSTLAECASCLLTEGAASVVGLALARAK